MHYSTIRTLSRLGEAGLGQEAYASWFSGRIGLQRRRQRQLLTFGGNFETILIDNVDCVQQYWKILDNMAGGVGWY